MWYNIFMKSPDTQKVLWDIAPEKIALLPSIFVIQRALSYGSISLIVSLMKQYGMSEVRAGFLALKPTAVPRRKYAYIKKYLLA
jgi:hypothetical protein